MIMKVRKKREKGNIFFLFFLEIFSNYYSCSSYLKFGFLGVLGFYLFDS